jgi:O-methyltransferase
MGGATIAPANPQSTEAEAYLDLLAGCLSRTIIPEYYQRFAGPTKWIYRIAYSLIEGPLRNKGYTLVRHYKVDPDKRQAGKDWPPDAETMIGLKRLDNLRQCIWTVLQDDIPGDLIETGVWRGGACIFMRGALRAYGDHSRSVWLADSFEGLPKPSPDKYAADLNDSHWEHNDYLAVSLEQVQANFARYGLLDDRVHFLKGWFSETLPSAPIEKLAILRLDGDMYESTIDAISALYPRLSPGGFVIVDDYWLKGCKAAIHDYRSANGIGDPMIDIDGSAVYWRRSH